MSERGSCVTECIYCNKCFEAVQKAFVHYFGEEYIVQVDSTPIVAAFVQGLYNGEELYIVQDLAENLAPELCCIVRIAVLPDGGGGEVVTAYPKKDEHNLTEYKQGHTNDYWWSETRCRQCGMLLEAEGNLFSKPLPTAQTS